MKYKCLFTILVEAERASSQLKFNFKTRALLGTCACTNSPLHESQLCQCNKI